MWATSLLPVLTAILCFPVLWLWLRRRSGIKAEENFQEAANLFYSSLFFAVFLVYPAISHTIVSTFAQR